MKLIREYVELNEAQSTVDMFWDVLTAMLEMADTSADKVLVNTILDHVTFRNLMTRSKMGLRSTLRGDARSKLIVLLRTINHVHQKLKHAGDVYVDKSVTDEKGAKATKPAAKEPAPVKEAADDSSAPKHHVKHDDAAKILTPDELPRLIKKMIEFADPEDSKKMAKAALGISPMKTLLTRARAVSMRVPSLVRTRIEDFEQSIA